MTVLEASSELKLVIFDNDELQCWTYEVEFSICIFFWATISRQSYLPISSCASVKVDIQTKIKIELNIHKFITAHIQKS